MRLDFARLTQLLNPIIPGPSKADRRAADARKALFRAAFGLRPDAVSLLDRLHQANGDFVDRPDALEAVRAPGRVVTLRPRSPELCMIEIRERVGADAIESFRDCKWRITPFGRLRLRLALGERFVA
ncbi:hypothetical protein [Brevundimonas nasdae]|uniref:hypothetical protein n=1 Tax=Brevundimonas nasdae TaxID=172043 RepID=UPI003F68BD8C